MRPVALRIVTVLLPVLALAGLELTLQLLPGLDADQHVDIGPVSFLTKVDVRGVPHYRLTHSSVYEDRRKTFAVVKPPRTFRVFCVGGSAAASWPHPPGETWSAYLEQALQAAYPEYRVEVINLGAHGFASYRVRHLLSTVVELDADLVIVWSGNNEFLESRTYDTSLSARILNSLPFDLRLVRLARKSLARAVLSGSELTGVKDVFWKKIKQESLALRADDAQFSLVRQHFAESVSAMITMAEDHDLPLLLMTVPVNLRDWLPNVSAPPPAAPDRSTWDEYLRQGRRFLLESNPEQAVPALSLAADLAPDHAATRFWLGRAREMAGRRAAALESYQEACDLDMNPFRAISPFNQTLRELASGAGGRVRFLDLAQEFRDASTAGLPGFDLFLDYVHPNRRGNLAAARSVFDFLLADDVLGPADGTTVFTHQDRLYHGTPYDEEFDLQLQTTVFGLFCLNHQYDAAIRTGHAIDRMIRTQRDRIQGVRGVPPTPPDQILDGVEAFTAWQNVEQRKILGDTVTAAEADRAKRLVAEFYERYFPYGVF